jgi:hypothetical protein
VNTRERTQRIGGTLAGTVAILAIVSVLSGCNIVGPAYYFIHGPEKVKKAYALDKEKPTTIFIDDRANHVPRRVLRLTIAQEAEKALLKKKVVKDMIAAESTMVAAGHDRYEKPIPIADIGRAVKADVLIYATVDAFTLTQDGQTYDPVARVRVKVLDARNDARLWPDDSRGQLLTVRVRPKTSPVPSSAAGRYEAEDELAKQVGLEIAWLFFDHEAEHGPKGSGS